MKLCRSLLTKGLLLSVLTATGCGDSFLDLLGPESKTELATRAQSSCGFVQNPYGQRVSWKSRSPVTFYLDNSVPTEFEAELRTAIDVWQKAIGREFLAIRRLNETFSGARNGRNEILITSNWPTTSTNQQALTMVYFKRNLISEADIRVNNQNFTFFIVDPPANNAVHFASLMLHEIGHALGLAHSPDMPTVMWPTLKSGLVRMEPSEMDKGNIKCEY